MEAEKQTQTTMEDDLNDLLGEFGKKEESEAKEKPEAQSQLDSAPAPVEQVKEPTLAESEPEVAEEHEVEAEAAVIELSPLEKENEELRRQLNELSSKFGQSLAQPQEASTQPEQVRQVEQKEQKQTAALGDMVQFVVSDDEFEEVFRVKESFNKTLNTVYQKATMDVLQRIPTMIGSVVHQQVTVQRLVDDFYRANNDLLPYREFVGYVVQELASQHPEYDYQKLFTEAETEARKRLNKQKQMQKTVTKAPIAPAPGARKPISQSQLSAMERDIQDLIVEED